jgi:hypothetical protein
MWFTHYITWNLLLCLIGRIWSITVILNKIESYTACFQDISLLYTGPQVNFKFVRTENEVCN